MSYDIGPSIGIEGEKAFKDAIKGINAQLKNLGSEMSSAMASFDKADKSEEKLTAQNKILEKSMEAIRSKITVLTMQYEKQKSELDSLGTALQNAKKKYGEQSTEAVKAQNAYNRQAKAVNDLGTQINNAATDLKTMEREVKSNVAAIGKLKNAADDGGSSVEDMGNSAEGMKEKVSDSGISIKATLATIGGAFAAMGASVKEAISFGDDYQNAFNNIKIKTRATAEEMRRFGDVMKDVYQNNFGENMGDVSDSLALVVQQLDKDWDDAQIKKITEHAITLRDAFGYEVQESVRATKALVTQFGISAEEAYGLLARGAQNGLDYSGELIDNVNEYSAQFQKVGLSAEDMFNIMQSGADAGAWNLDKIGDAVKEFSIRAIDGSNTTIDGFTKLGLNADEMASKFASGGDVARDAFYQVIQGLREMDDPVTQSIAGVDLFGTMWEDLGPEVVTQLDSVKNGYSDIGTVMDDIANDKYNNFSSAMSGLGRTIQIDFLLPISQSLVPKLKETSERLKEAFQNPPLQDSMMRISASLVKMADGFASFVANSLPGLINGFSWVIDNGSRIAAVIVGIGTAIIGIKSGIALAGFLAKVEGGTKGIATILTVLKAALAALGGPITLIVAGIAAIVAAFVTLYATNEDFRNAVNNTFGAIKEFFVNTGESIKTFFTETIPNAFNSVKEFFTVTIPGVFNMVLEFFKSNWQGILLFIVNPFAGAFKLIYDNCEGFRETVNSIINAVVGFFQGIPEKIGNFLAALPERMGVALGAALSTVVQWGVNLKQFVTQTIPEVVDNIILWFSELPGKLKQWLSDTLQRIIDWGSELKTQGQAAAVNLVNTFVSFIQTLPQRVMEWLSGVVTKIIEFGSDAKSKALEAAAGIVQTIIDTIAGLPAKMLEIGGNIVDGLIGGIKDKAKGVQSAISEFVKGFKKGFTSKDALDVNSPSKWAYSIGGFVVDGLVNAVMDGTGKARVAADKFSGVLKASLGMAASDLAEKNSGIKKEQSKFWDELVKITAEGTKEMTDAEEKALREQEAASKEIYDKSTKWIEKKKFYGQLCAADEIKAWQITVEKEGLLASEREQIERNLYTAKKTLADEQRNLEEEYQKNLESRTNALSSFAGLFDRVEKKTDITGSTLLGNLKSQVDAFKIWQEDIQKLSERGITDNLLSELREMGPKAASEINALTTLTDDELNEYVSLFKEKGKIAADQAQSEIGGIKLPFVIINDEETDAVNMENLLLEAAKTTDVLTQGIQENMYKISDIAQKLALTYIEKINQCRDGFYRAGANMVNGLWEGIASGKSGLINNIVRMLEDAVRAAKMAMDINSPSKVWGEIGGHMASGLGVGFVEQMKTVTSKINSSIPTAPSMSSVVQSAKIGEGMVNGITSAMGMSQSASAAPINLQVVLDSKVIAQTIFDPLKQVSRQRGVSLG